MMQAPGQSAPVVLVELCCGSCAVRLMRCACQNLAVHRNCAQPAVQTYKTIIEGKFLGVERKMRRQPNRLHLQTQASCAIPDRPSFSPARGDCSANNYVNFGAYFPTR